MEIFITGVVQAAVSGVILLIITKTVEKNNSASQRAVEAEKRLITKELSDMMLKVTSLEQKQDALVSAFQALKEKVILMSQKQDDMYQRLYDLTHSVDKIKDTESYGRVLKK